MSNELVHINKESSPDSEKYDFFYNVIINSAQARIIRTFSSSRYSVSNKKVSAI